MQAIKNVLKLLVELMEEWQLILTEKAQATFHEPVSSAAAKSATSLPLLCITCSVYVSCLVLWLCLLLCLLFHLPASSTSTISLLAQ